jgi:hypothetical protein
MQGRAGYYAEYGFGRSRKGLPSAAERSDPAGEQPRQRIWRQIYLSAGECGMTAPTPAFHGQPFNGTACARARATAGARARAPYHDARGREHFFVVCAILLSFAHACVNSQGRFRLRLMSAATKLQRSPATIAAQSRGGDSGQKPRIARPTVRDRYRGLLRSGAKRNSYRGAGEVYASLSRNLRFVNHDAI